MKHFLKTFCMFVFPLAFIWSFSAHAAAPQKSQLATQTNVVNMQQAIECLRNNEVVNFHPAQDDGYVLGLYLETQRVKNTASLLDKADPYDTLKTFLEKMLHILNNVKTQEESEALLQVEAEIEQNKKQAAALDAKRAALIKIYGSGQSKSDK